ncbi:sulfite exporter TauE/SafE family protein [Actinomadura formosensis]|uniref:sulfite exporter TauE/SafE family protein n=1 Tax=Actinomadura formosensis TaxID=60706 RepID=UPI0008370A21|nr:sulfite exporter TauE/SafE family protein [Actinomadura formosensis]
MTLVLALVLGLLIGGVLGALGGGGAILTVPLLVYVLGQDARAATAASLIIVGLTAVAGTAGHARAGRVRWGTGVVFGSVGAVAAIAGTAVNRLLNPDLLMLGFAVLMGVAATGMLLRAAPEEQTPPDGPRSVVPGGILAGLGVGFLTGLFGVGGGFVIVPALVLALRMRMPAAVGTSLLVVAINSAASLAARGGGPGLDWAVVLPFTAAAVAGALAGGKVAERLPTALLTRAFAVLLLAVGGCVAVTSAAALG